MTQEEKYDRWERFARLFYKRVMQDSRESRKQLEKLRALMEERKKQDEAFSATLKSDPVDPQESSRM